MLIFIFKKIMTLLSLGAGVKLEIFLPLQVQVDFLSNSCWIPLRPSVSHSAFLPSLQDPQSSSECVRIRVHCEGGEGTREPKSEGVGLRTCSPFPNGRTETRRENEKLEKGSVIGSLAHLWFGTYVYFSHFPPFEWLGLWLQAS